MVVSKLGRLIVIEGVDASGKSTQLKLLTKRLKKEGHDAITWKFPQYDTYFGELVAKYLRGEFGLKEELPVEVPTLLFALDRYKVKKDVQQTLLDGTSIIMDRYTTSNLAFQGAKFEGTARIKLIEWMEAIEARMPQPDAVFFLDVPREFSKYLRQGDDLRIYLNGKEDIHEKDDAYQQEVAEVYRWLAKTRQSWTQIPCVEDNKLLSIEIIAEKIWKYIEPLLR